MKKLIIATIIIRLIFVVLNMQVWQRNWEQDNYLSYSRSLKNGTLQDLDDTDKRLFPGYPVLILAFSSVFSDLELSGILISLLASVFAVLLIVKICKSVEAGWLMAFFPPIWLKMGVKIATEPLFVALCGLAIYLYLKRNYWVTGVIMGIAFTVRPVGITLLVTMLLFLWGKWRDMGQVVMGSTTMILSLLLFNYWAFGNMFEQFVHGERYGLTFGVIQLGRDLWRTWDWGQYRILVSGLIYIGMYLGVWWYLFKNFKQAKINGLMATWMALTLMYILSFSPVTLIDDFGRYTLAALPALIFGLSRMIFKPTLNISQAKRQRTD